jgi:hypothetical protein
MFKIERFYCNDLVNEYILRGILMTQTIRAEIAIVLKLIAK